MKRTKQKGIVVLSCDPSLTAFGYVVICREKILETGCIKTAPSKAVLRIRKSDDRMRRISEINQVLKKAIETHGVTYIVAELPHGSQNAVAAISLGMVASIPQTIADILDFGIEMFSEGDSKRALLGKHSAAKQETIDAVDCVYAVDWTGVKYKDEAIADSLSVYYAAVKLSPYIKTLNR